MALIGAEAFSFRVNADESTGETEFTVETGGLTIRLSVEVREFKVVQVESDRLEGNDGTIATLYRQVALITKAVPKSISVELPGVKEEIQIL